MRSSIRNKRGTAALLLSLTLAVPAIALGANASPAKGPPVAPPQAMQIRSFAAATLKQIAQARRDVGSHQLPKAERELAEASILLDMTAASRPTGAAQSLLHYLRLELDNKDNRQALPDLLPAYGALGGLGTSAAVQAARSHLDGVKRALEDGNRAAALKALAKVEKDLSIDAIDLPLGAARDTLNRLLNHKDDKPTFDDSQLQSLEDNLLTVVDGANNLISP